MPTDDTPTVPSLAFVDESESDAARDPHTYLLAAAVVSGADVDTVRHGLLGLRPTRRGKLHWTKVDHATRVLVASHLATAPLRFYVAVHEGRAGEHPERRRRKCMERLLLALEDEGISSVVAESRGPGDRKDHDHLNALRRAKVVRHIHLRHEGGPVEPLLWAADAMCGAMVRSRTGDDRFIQALRSKLTIVHTC